MLKAPMPALSVKFIAAAVVAVAEPHAGGQLIREQIWLPENLRELKDKVY